MRSIAVLMYSGSLRMSEIVASQDTVWNVIPQFPAFVDLPDRRARRDEPPAVRPARGRDRARRRVPHRVPGIKFAMFYLGEYLNTVTVAAVATTLWLGGWRGPAPEFLPWLWPLLWFLLKVLVVIYVYIWIRATLPRIRYDRLMAFGWKFLIPFGLVWVLATGAVVVLPDVYGRRSVVTGAALLVGAVLVLLAHLAAVPRRPEAEQARDDPRTERAPASADAPRVRRLRIDRLGGDASRRAWGPCSSRSSAATSPSTIRTRSSLHRPRSHIGRHLLNRHDERPGEVHRVRALRLRLPGRRDLGRGRGQRPGEPDEPGGAVREGLPDQLPRAASCAASASRPVRRARSR